MFVGSTKPYVDLFHGLAHNLKYTLQEIELHLLGVPWSENFHDGIVKLFECTKLSRFFVFFGVNESSKFANAFFQLKRMIRYAL